MKNTEPSVPFLTIAQASSRLDDMGGRTIRRYCAKGIVGRKIGRDWMLSEGDLAVLEKFKSRQRGNPNWIEVGDKKAKKRPEKQRKKEIVTNS